jgi:hypothetical protein
MSVTAVSESALRAYRQQTFRLKASLRLRSQDDAVAFVNERGFVHFWPIKGADLPSLWMAVAGDRPVADRHDDPGHVTWGWKDRLLGSRRWYYGKLLKGKATMVSLKVLPYFYALSENYGDPEDYLLEYEAGQLSQEARQVYEALLEQGELDSLSLRRESRLAGKESNSRFERALVELQRGLKIVPVGVAEAGRWRYAFVYQTLARWFPDLAEQARAIGRSEARTYLASLYVRSVGATTPADIARLFGWKPEESRKAAERLVTEGTVVPAAHVAGQPGHWLVAGKLARV